MKSFSLRRNRGSELCFEGEHLATVDDREWLGVTANWWELALYRTSSGTFVLSSVYYQNSPRGATVYDAKEMHSLNEVHEALARCGSPEMIREALLVRARRSIKHMDEPAPPMRWREEDSASLACLRDEARNFANLHA